MKVKHLAECNLYWVVGKGDIHFWKKMWFGGIWFANLGDPPEWIQELKVRDGIKNTGDCLSLCKDLI